MPGARHHGRPEDQRGQHASLHVNDARLSDVAVGIDKMVRMVLSLGAIGARDLPQADATAGNQSVAAGRSAHFTERTHRAQETRAVAARFVLRVEPGGRPNRGGKDRR